MRRVLAAVALTTMTVSGTVLSSGVVMAGSPLGRLGSDAVDERFNAYDPMVWVKTHDWDNGPGFGCGFHAGNLTFKNSRLTLALTRRPVRGKPYACAEYQSRKHYGFGTYAARLRAAHGDGVITSLMSYTGQPFRDQWDEIKLAVFGEDPTRLRIGYFVKGAFHEAAVVDLGFDASAGFHDYGFDWQPERIVFTVDGKPVHTQTGTRDELPQSPGKLYVQLVNGDGQQPWLKPFSDPGHPITAEVDWLRFTAAPTATAAR